MKKYIRDVPDFPKPGIIFKDIAPLLRDGKAFHYAVDQLCEHYRDAGIQLVVGPESRGFIFGAAVAYNLGVGFVPIRKEGKLPWKTISEEYELEYGKDIVEMHEDAVEEGQNVLICDDLLATGGTALATAKLVEKTGGIVHGIGVAVELSYLNGREKLSDYDVFSSIQYDE